MANPTFTITMEDGKTMSGELYPDKAPNSVRNFIALAQSGFYNGLTFHRVIPGFMIQGGCPQGTGTGGPGYTIKGEFNANGFRNDLLHDRGVLSMARAMSPNSVRNFIALARAGFYDGLTFHRVIPGFMIQGGCPQGTGTGGPGYTIKGEFAANGFKNDLRHDRGVLSMARAMSPNSAGSQFFIMVEKAPHLDGQYAAFGKVTGGMETADAIVDVPTDFNDKPTTPQRIQSITVDTHGEDYPAPEKV